MDADHVVAVLLGHAEVPATKFLSCKQHLDQPGLAEIASALSCKSHAGVKGLRLEGCSIGDSGARLLADALCSNTDLQTLELPNNYIGVDGATAFAHALQLQNCVLKVLDLSGNPCQVTATGILQDIEKSLHRNRVIKRAADRRAVVSPSTPVNPSTGVVTTPTTARKLSYWPSPSETHGDNSLEIEQRLQQLEDNFGLLSSELEHIRRLGASLESWSKQVDAASSQVAAVLNLVDSTSQETLQRLMALESWRAAADIASNGVSKVLQKLNEDIKFVDGRLSRLEEVQGTTDGSGIVRPTIIEIIDERPPSERASCSKVTPLSLTAPTIQINPADEAVAESSPEPSAPAQASTPAGHTGLSTPAVVPTTPRSMHSSLSDLRVPSPSQTPTRLSPVTWHDNATALAIAASLERLNLRNTNSSTSTTSRPSRAEDGECTPSPSAATPEVPTQLNGQQELELKLAEQQQVTDRLTARLEQLELLLSNLPQAAPQPQLTDACVQTTSPPTWHALHSADEAHCSISATTIPNNRIPSPDSLAATSDAPGPSTKPLPSLSTVRESPTPSLHLHIEAASSVTLQTAMRESAFMISQPTPKRVMKSSKAALQHLVSSMESCHSSQPATDLPPVTDPVTYTSSTPHDAKLPPSDSSPQPLSHRNVLANSRDPVQSLGSPNTPAQPPNTRPPINSALWLSTSSLVTPGSEASDSDVYQNLLRFVDGLHPNPIGIDLAEKLALLARASQALSLREEQEQCKPDPSVDSSTVRLPTPPNTIPPSPDSKPHVIIDDDPSSVSACNSPLRSPLLDTSSPAGVTPYPLHFSTMSASFDSSMADELRRPGSSRSSPYKPHPSPSCSPACKPRKSPSHRAMPPTADISALTRSVLTSQDSSPFIAVMSHDSTAPGTSVTADTWHSSSDFKPSTGHTLFSHPEAPGGTPPRMHEQDDDLSSLVRDVINQVDQNVVNHSPSSFDKKNSSTKISKPIDGMDVLLDDVRAHMLHSDAEVAARLIGVDQGAVPSCTEEDVAFNDQSCSAVLLHDQQVNNSLPGAMACSDVVLLGGSVASRGQIQGQARAQDEPAMVDSAVLRGSIPAPVADMDGSFELHLPEAKERATVLPILPETRQLPVDVSRNLPISPTPPTPINSASEPIPTLFNMAVCTTAPPPNPLMSAAPQKDASNNSHGSSILMASVSIHVTEAMTPQKSNLGYEPVTHGAVGAAPAVQEGEVQAAVSRAARLQSRPIMLNETLRASEELSLGWNHGQPVPGKAGGVHISGTSFPTTPSSSASSTPRPASTTGNARSGRPRSGTTSASQTPRTSAGSLPRGVSKPAPEATTPASHKTPRPDGRPAAGLSNHNVVPIMENKNTTPNTPQPKTSSTPFRDASMQRFLLRRGIGKKGAAGSPTPAIAGSSQSSSTRAGSEYSRSGKPSSAADPGMEVDSVKQTAMHGGRKKLMRAMNALARPIKALMGGPSANDMPLRMHGPKTRRKSTMEVNHYDTSVMIAPRALSENTAAYYRYQDPSDSTDAPSALGGMMVRRMLSETAAGQIQAHSHRYVK